MLKKYSLAGNFFDGHYSFSTYIRCFFLPIVFCRFSVDIRGTHRASPKPPSQMLILPLLLMSVRVNLNSFICSFFHVSHSRSVTRNTFCWPLTNISTDLTLLRILRTEHYTDYVHKRRIYQNNEFRYRRIMQQRKP